MTTLEQIRSDGEADVLLLLSQLDERHKLILRDAIKQYGRVQNIPESVWADIQQDTAGGTVKDKDGNNTTLTAAILLMVANADDLTAGQLDAQGVATQGLSTRHLAGYSLEAARQAATSASQTTATVRSRLARKVEDEALSPVGGVGTATDEGIDAAIDDVMTEVRRATIATDLTTGALTAGQIGAAERVVGDDGAAIGINGQRMTVALVWRTERDFLVCPRCSPLEGQPEEVWSLIFPEGPGDDAHPNCVLPDQLACVPGHMKAATDSFYVGECIEVLCASGRKLSVTSNHMVLTGRGWVEARRLVNSDYVFASPDPERIAASVDPDNDHRPALIEQVFDSVVMAGSMSPGRVPTTTEDLDGNARTLNRQVNVVNSDRQLWNGSDSSRQKIGRHSAVQVRSDNEFLTSGGPLELFAPAVNSTPCCGVCGGHLPSPGGIAHRRPLDRFGLGLAPYRNTQLPKSISERGSRNASLHRNRIFGLASNVTRSQFAHSRNLVSQRPDSQSLGLFTRTKANTKSHKRSAAASATDAKLGSQFIRRFASLISADQIIRVRRFKFSGQVYDLQCDPWELFFVNGIIAHNCRCYLEVKAVPFVEDSA